MCVQKDKPTLVYRGNASVVFTRLTALDNSCIVKTSGGDTCGSRNYHTDIEGSHVLGRTN